MRHHQVRPCSALAYSPLRHLAGPVRALGALVVLGLDDLHPDTLDQAVHDAALAAIRSHVAAPEPGVTCRVVVDLWRTNKDTLGEPSEPD